jgi:hypothetical protein
MEAVFSVVKDRFKNFVRFESDSGGRANEMIA